MGMPKRMMHDRYFHWLSRFFFAPGYTSEDMLQEARLAAWLARPGYERLAARRRCIEIVRASKRRPEFAYLSEHHAAPENMHDIAEARDRLRRMASVPLSALERRALAHSTRGDSVTESKAIDNALQRARRKLRAA